MQYHFKPEYKTIAEPGASLFTCIKSRLVMKMLHLNITNEAFAVMVTGEKTNEYRLPSDWIKSRLFTGKKNKIYDRIKFTAGYGRNKPYFICTYKGYCLGNLYTNIVFSNGLKIEKGQYYEIKLGSIIEVGNYQYPLKSSHKSFRTISGILDQLGLATNIMRVGKRAYNLIINGEIIRVYTKRQNAKMRIIKLLNEKIQNNGFTKISKTSKTIKRRAKNILPIQQYRKRKQAITTGAV